MNEDPVPAQRDEITERPRLPSEEIARLGREMYERDIRHQLETDHHGEVVAIDVDSRRWAVAGDTIAAVDRLRDMEPGAVNILCERVGYPALVSFGMRGTYPWASWNRQGRCR